MIKTGKRLIATVAIVCAILCVSLIISFSQLLAQNDFVRPTPTGEVTFTGCNVDSNNGVTHLSFTTFSPQTSISDVQIKIEKINDNTIQNSVTFECSGNCWSFDKIISGINSEDWQLDIINADNNNIKGNSGISALTRIEFKNFNPVYIYNVAILYRPTGKLITSDTVVCG